MGLPTTTMERVIQARAREGWAAALQPSHLLQAPIWWRANLATRFASAQCSYTMRENGYPTTWIAESVNPLPVPAEGEKQRDQPHGLLRYSDLDVLMAMSYYFSRYGRALIEVEQRTILTWMGYSRMDEAPYRELRASLQRMASTTIAVHGQGETIKDFVPSRLIALHKIRQGGGPSTRGMITASLADEWVYSLTKGFTVVDMHAYANLCRTDRELGLARVIYLFLASIRQPDGRFECPLSWISERYRDRKGIGGQIIYSNPLDERSRLLAALKFLNDSGVLALNQLEVEPGREPRLTGVFAPASQIPKIHEPDTYQMTIWPVNRLVGGVDPNEGEGGRENKELIVPKDPGPSSEQSAEVDQKAQSQTAMNMLITESISGLCTHLGVSTRVVRRHLGKEGWDDTSMVRMLFQVAWKWHHQEVEKPAAYVATILKKSAGDAVEWTKALNKEIRDWSYSDQSPLKHLRDLSCQVAASAGAPVAPQAVPLATEAASEGPQASDGSHLVSQAAAQAALGALDVRVTPERIQALLLSVHGVKDPAAISQAAKGLASFWKMQDEKA